MRLLLLALTILAFLPQVTPAYSGEKKCWNKSGQCRKKCQDGELTREICKNRRVCCISSNRGFRISKVTQKTTTAFYKQKTTTAFYDSFYLITTTMFDDTRLPAPTVFYEDMQTTTTTYYDFTDMMKMILTTDNFEANKQKDDGGKSDRKHETQTPDPEIHHSSS